MKNVLTAGTVLKNGLYKIEKTLGQGSFGITYSAFTKVITQGSLGKMEVEVRVAIKEFFMSDLNSREPGGSMVEGSGGNVFTNYRRKFHKEAEHLSKISHPNIVRVMDIFEENNTTYYVMQYLEGQNLDDYIKEKGNLSEMETMTLISQIGEALRYMHQRKMLHLDLKPKNIMIDQAGSHVTLIDFGLSKQFNEQGEPESSTSIGFGTPGYAPLEQASYERGNNFPASIDVYALGATMFKMLTGQRPPDATTILNYGFPDDELWKKGVSIENVDSIRRAMAPIQGKRWQEVGQFLDSISMIHVDRWWNTEGPSYETHYSQTQYADRREDRYSGNQYKSTEDTPSIKSRNNLDIYREKTRKREASSGVLSDIPKASKRNSVLRIAAIFGILIVSSMFFMWIAGVFTAKDEPIYAEVEPVTEEQLPEVIKYPVVELMLRNSKVIDGYNNRITAVPTGSRLKVIEDNGEWAKVKFKSSDINSTELTGYVLSRHLLNENEFILFNRMYDSPQAFQDIETSRSRKALIKYFLENNMTGNLSSDSIKYLNLPTHTPNPWAVTSQVLFKSAYNPGSKFEDMCVVIRNNNLDQGRLLYFTFNDDESSVLRLATPFPPLKSIDDFNVDNSRKNISILSDGSVQSFSLQR